MRRILIASLVVGGLPALAQVDKSDDLSPQKRAELREAVKAQQMQSMGIGGAEVAPAERKLTLQELSEMREQLRKQREARRGGTPSQ